ncbi:MAG TPA: choice-of-anchor tandem repeat GloVer-containing protein, partial [Polyangiaceae bacterium]
MKTRPLALVLLPLIACGGSTSDPVASVSSAATAPAPYVTVTTMHALTRDEGGHSRAPLLEGSDGRFYGVGEAGGPNAGGDATHTCSSNFYSGTTVWTEQCPGSLYAVSRAGTFEMVHGFGQLDPTLKRNTDGYQPVTGLTQGSDGWLYGVAPMGGEGGLKPTTPGCGTAYRVQPAAPHAFETLWNFCSDPGYAAGAYPRGLLLPDGAGGWYGAAAGGPNSSGVIFHLLDHAASPIVDFGPKGATNTSGNLPYATPVPGADGRLYGAATYGGVNDQGAVYAVDSAQRTLTAIASLGPG